MPVVQFSEKIVDVFGLNGVNSGSCCTDWVK